jgi:3-methyladenine DNA glycosylase AlkD
MNEQFKNLAARVELGELADSEKAKILQRFFKTGPGEYAEGDIFLGVTVPKTRQVAKKHPTLSDLELLSLLKSPIHEERLLALLIWVAQFKSAEEKRQKQIYEIYLKNTDSINNWDLVDLSADKIVGAYLFTRDRSPLSKLVVSKNFWERRIAIVATFHFIKNHDYSDTFTLARLLLNDKEDLIHKAVGWMLREAGKRDLAALENFLYQNYRRMPRTMLRYAIERFPEAKRQEYLKGEI